MFRDRLRTAPFVNDIADVELRLKTGRADAVLFLESNMRLPHLRVQ